MGSYIAHGTGQELFVLAMNADGWGGNLVAVDGSGPSITATWEVGTQGVYYRALTYSARHDRLYLLGNRPSEPGADPGRGGPSDAVVTVLDGGTGRRLGTWTARPAGGRDWFVWNAAVSPDDTRLYLSYHSPDATGLDWLDITSAEPRPCWSNNRGSPTAGVGCIAMHGGFLFEGDLLVATTGGPSIEEVTEHGAVTRQYDTGLQGNHLMVIAPDAVRHRVLALGGCDYAGGLAAVDLESSQASLLSRTHTGVCGERISAGPDFMVIAQNAQSVPHPGAVGQLLIVGSITDVVRYRVAVPAEVLDLV